MQHLVQLTPHLRGSLSATGRDGLLAAERKRSLELQGEGKVTRMWRVSGTRDGIALWDVPFREELHASDSFLSAWRYCDDDIVPVIQHPIEAEFQKGAPA